MGYLPCIHTSTITVLAVGTHVHMPPLLGSGLLCQEPSSHDPCGNMIMITTNWCCKTYPMNELQWFWRSKTWEKSDGQWLRSCLWRAPKCLFWNLFHVAFCDVWQTGFEPHMHVYIHIYMYILCVYIYITYKKCTYGDMIGDLIHNVAGTQQPNFPSPRGWKQFRKNALVCSLDGHPLVHCCGASKQSRGSQCLTSSFQNNLDLESGECGSSTSKPPVVQT